MLYHIRITCEPDDFINLFNFDKYYICQHLDTDRNHYHLIIETNLTDSGIRGRLKLRYKGNGVFSVKQADETGYQYISHEGSKFHSSNIKTFKEYEILKSKSSEYVQEKIKSKKSIFRMLKDQVVTGIITNNTDKYGIAASILDIVEKHDKMVPSKFQAKQYIETIYLLSRTKGSSYRQAKNSLIETWFE